MGGVQLCVVEFVVQPYFSCAVHFSVICCYGDGYIEKCGEDSSNSSMVYVVGGF